MTKAKLINRIIDRLIDPWTDSPSDYLDAELIDLDTAKDIIRQCREEDDDLEPEDRLPAETTPALMMEAFNCHVRHMKFEARVSNLADFITDNEMVCEYVNYYEPTLENPVTVIPVDCLYNTNRFPFATNNTENPDIIDTLRIGLNSAKTFNSNHEFCWFDKDKEVLHSTNTPFADGILDADAFARFILCDADSFGYFVNCIMLDDDIRSVFGCSKEDLLKEVTF